MPSIFGMLDNSTSVEEEEVEQAVKKNSPTNKLKIAKNFQIADKHPFGVCLFYCF
ncbi:hypothetical protein SSUR61_1227 [Streptococcus suis R61]|uniref:Uncharacterized protein n=1 Tax=Streptococcus suis R61 TaxID=996306 RepID=A0AA87K4X7_STRSU|nr:hypothetical protein SSUR61_1227 [Streptococcus suis R61]